MGSSQSSSQNSSPIDDHLSLDARKIQEIAHVLDVKAKTHNPLKLQEDVDWDLEQDKENVRLLKGLFKTLDPTVVRVPGDVHGQIKLSFKYEKNRHLLLVKVVQCRDLRSKDIRSRASAPYVKLQMYPDNHSHGIKTTQIMVETKSPVYNEIFAFKASEEELRESRLIAQVWDYDVVSHDDFLGELILETCNLNFQEEPVITAWFDLLMETDLSVTGQLSVAVDFQMPGSLFVTVHNARGLSPRTGNHTADPFIKVGIPGIGCVYSSQVRKDTLDPEWDETYEFEVAVEELSFRYLVFHVVDQTSLMSENFSMGQAVLDLDVIETKPNQHFLLKLTDLKNTEKMQNKLMQRVVTQEFREAFLAHMMSRQPEFLFQKHRGSKLVRVSCRKAGRTSRVNGQVRILDGIPVY